MLQSSAAPNTRDMVVVATGKMRQGVCVAGIDPDTGEWLRPVRSADRQARALPLTVDHVKTDREVLFRNLHLTRVPVSGPCPAPPHVEDWLLDTTRRPKVLRQLNDDQARRFLEAQANGHLPELLAAHSRSLCLIKPDSYAVDVEVLGGDLRVRIDFVHDTCRYRRVTCTDLKLRHFARGFARKHQLASGTIGRENFERDLHTQVYLVVGLSRLDNGRYWPVVLGFHTVPAYPGDIDWARI